MGKGAGLRFQSVEDFDPCAMSALPKIGPFEIGAIPRVVGVLSSPLSLDRLASGWRPACDILELRVDLLGAGLPDWLDRALDLEKVGQPLLITIRHAREGGHWYGPEEERLALYTRVLPYVSAVDFEIRSVGFADMVKQAHQAGKPLVASFHDFQGMPPDAGLRAIIAEAEAARADIIKIAVVVEDEPALARLEALQAAHRGAPLCLLGMGPMGPASRTRLPARGSCLTYGYADEANVAGQLSSAELVEHLRQTVPGYRPAPNV